MTNCLFTAKVTNGTWNVTKAAKDVKESTKDELAKALKAGNAAFTTQLKADTKLCFPGYAPATNGTINGTLVKGEPKQLASGKDCTSAWADGLKLCKEPAKADQATAFKSALALMTLGIYAATLV